jgi:2-iminobutanoate/2-iminopropanoate deaminase
MTIFDNPAGVPAPPPGRYSHLASVDLGTARLLLLSGQVAVDADGKLIGPDDMTAQTDAIFAQIGTILAAHDAGFEHVISIRSYLTDMDRLAEYGTARRKYFSGDKPTSTTVGVSRLFIDGALLEAEVMAVVQA